MEHRCYPRKAIDSPVMVYQEQIGMIKATVKNISANGVLVNIGRYALSKGVIVELAKPTVERLQGEIPRLTALIVHADDGVAGMMFVGHRNDDDAFRMSLEKRYDEDRPSALSKLRRPLETGEPARAVAYASHNWHGNKKHRGLVPSP